MPQDPAPPAAAASRLEKAGTVGALIAAAACPVCFPKLALIGAAFGFGVLAPYEGTSLIVVLILVAVAWLAQLAAYRRHRSRALLAWATLATVTLYAGFFVAGSTLLMQAGLVALFVASVWLVLELRRCARCARAGTPAL
jgi:mercuric ion transport protein